MPSSKDGIMVILSSPSGAGKTTLVNLLSKQNNFEISISHTTRQPRQGEVPNKDYFFVSDVEFKRLINNQEFLEYAKVFNNYYVRGASSRGAARSAGRRAQLGRRPRPRRALTCLCKQCVQIQQHYLARIRASTRRAMGPKSFARAS